MLHIWSKLNKQLSSISTGNKRYYETLRLRGAPVLRPCFGRRLQSNFTELSIVIWRVFIIVFTLVCHSCLLLISLHAITQFYSSFTTFGVL